jgi:hypothetical protein
MIGDFNMPRPECIECLDTNLKDPAHRIKEIDCYNCKKEK